MIRNIYAMRSSELRTYVRSLYWLRWGWALFHVCAIATVSYICATTRMGTASSTILGFITGLVAVFPLVYANKDYKTARDELGRRL